MISSHGIISSHSHTWHPKLPLYILSDVLMTCNSCTPSHPFWRIWIMFKFGMQLHLSLVQRYWKAFIGVVTLVEGRSCWGWYALHECIVLVWKIWWQGYALVALPVEKWIIQMNLYGFYFYFCGAVYVVTYQRRDNTALPPSHSLLRGQLELSQEISFLYDLRVLVRKRCIYADQFCIVL